MTTKRIFISYDYDNDRHYKNLLVAWDKNKEFDFNFYDGSVTVAVDSADADYIKSRIKPKIEASSHFLCLVGKHAHKSKWIDWEIRTAISLKKRLIAVKIEKDNTTPSALLNVGATWALSFNFDAIKKAVDSA
jgi:exopolysaccharide biosynthesis protein